MKISTNAAVAMFTLLAVAASTFFLTPSLAVADEPETVEVTFGIFVDVGLLRDDDEDGIPDLPELTGEDAVGVLIEGGGIPATLETFGSSPPCGDFDVAYTSWNLLSTAKIILKGGRPIDGYVYDFGGPPFLAPPLHTFLRKAKITSSHACWAKLSGGNWLIVTDPSIAEKVFIVLTGEFRLDDLEF